MPLKFMHLDISKRLMDYNFHPPTNYFPLIVHEALMVEPTESESKETLDAFADALLKIADEAHHNPLLLKDAPHNTPVGTTRRSKGSKGVSPLLRGGYTDQITRLVRSPA